MNAMICPEYGYVVALIRGSCLEDGAAFAHRTETTEITADYADERG